MTDRRRGRQDPKPSEWTRHFINIVLLASIQWVLHGQALAQALATDQLITTAHHANGDPVPYLLTSDENVKPRYILILMPGGAGNMNLKWLDGQISFGFKSNFLIRSRTLFADEETVVISTDASGSEDRMGAIVADAKQRFPDARVFILGTSRSTLDTIQLATRMDGKVAGFVHTASFSAIAWLDTTALKSRHLLVHHQKDGCRHTLYGGALRNHEDFGTPLITMDGGVSVGDPCEALAFHGFNGIEKETVNKIRAWIMQP